jgi:hypothetical protein
MNCHCGLDPPSSDFRIAWMPDQVRHDKVKRIQDDKRQENLVCHEKRS